MAPLKRFFLAIMIPLIAIGTGVWLVGVLTNAVRTNFAEAGLGAGTSSHFSICDGLMIHGSVEQNEFDWDKTPTIAQTLEAWRAAHSPPVVLWLGNSQLHGINQSKDGDEGAAYWLAKDLAGRNLFVLCLSQPNANLQEHLLVFTRVLAETKPRILILPVVFDDLRESGLRHSLLPAFEQPSVASQLKSFPPFAPYLNAAKQVTATSGVPQPPGSNNLHSEDTAGVAGTTQEITERSLESWLSSKSTIWASRAEARGDYYFWLYETRNKLLGINPQTKRHMIPDRQQTNFAALNKILEITREEKIPTLLYVPPLRSDVATPYVAEEYSQFKNQLNNLAEDDLISVVNLEELVPAKYWGATDGEAIDFMHFQGPAHKLLGSRIATDVIHALGLPSVGGSSAQ